MEPFDWTAWKPKIPATLLFIVREDEILLIKKKRGHGMGKINGPGGKIDPGETPLQGAIRETYEELCIHVKDARKVAELCFEMSDYPNLLCHVFLASEYTGTPTETAEAIPLWTKISEIPYDQMWEDDQYWLPRILAGETLVGKFRFNAETLMEKKMFLTNF